MQIAAELTQFLDETLGRGKSERDALHVHDRLGKPCMQQHVTPIVHVGEGMTRRRPAQCGIDRMELLQRIGPEA